jgi:hypothetical protein
VGSGVLRRRVDRVVPLDDDTWWDLPGEFVLRWDEHSFRGNDLCITVALQAPERRVLPMLADDRIRPVWMPGLRVFPRPYGRGFGSGPAT